MSPTLVRALRIDEDQWEALRQVYERDGVPVSEQVKRALNMWLESKGVQPKATPATRRKHKSS